jgi:outer membrane protein TolC
MLERCLTVAILLLWVLSAKPVNAQDLGLKQAERLVLERNLDLRAQAFETRASEALVRRGYGIYDPRLQVDLAEGTSRQRFNSPFFAAKTTTDYRQFDFLLTQKLPSGADLIAGFANRREAVGVNPPPPIDPSYASELRFTLVQPLLRNFGPTVTEQQILFAVKDRDASVQDLRERAFELISRVRDTWFDALRTRDQLAYRQTSVALAQKVLDENRVRVEVGVLPPVEILEAEVGLLTRERLLLDAQRAYQDVLDNLGVLINAGGTVEVAEETLGLPALETGMEAGYRSALEKRPDLLRRMKEIERLYLENRIARNQLLPAVDLSGSYAHVGLGKDYSADFDDLSSDDFRNWEVALTVSYPLGNREARNEYLRSRQRLKGRHALLAQLHEEIGNEVRGAIRQLEVSRKIIEVSSRGRDLSEEKLRTLLKRKEVGLATTRDVLEGEEDMALARTDQITALADYNKAVTEYLRVTGQLLEHEGIRLVGPIDAQGDRPMFDMTLQ